MCEREGALYVIGRGAFVLQLTEGFVLTARRFAQGFATVGELNLRKITPVLGGLPLLFRGIQMRRTSVSYQKTAATAFGIAVDVVDSFGAFLNRNLLRRAVFGPHSFLLHSNGRRGHVVRTHEYCSFQLDMYSIITSLKGSVKTKRQEKEPIP